MSDRDPGDIVVNDITTESTVEKDTPDAKEQARVKGILTIAHKEFKTCATATEHFRAQAVDDTKFRAGTWGKKTFQWPAQIQEAREAKQRACITVNRMPGFVRLVTNQARQANLRIQVNPVDDNGDPKIAEVLQGIIRNIEQQSFADRAYNKASDKQGEIGLGIFRLLTEWAAPSDKENWRQRIRIRRVRNPLRVYVDARCEEPDWSDAEVAFYVTDLDKTAYMELTGKTEEQMPTPASLEAFEGNGDASGDWFPNGKIRIAEYFKKERTGERTRFAQLSDGTVIPYPDEAKKAELKAAAIGIVNARWVEKKQVVWRKIDATSILEESIWPADSQPFIPVMGEELEVDGEIDYRGVVRDAKGSAQVYNVQVTALMEQVGLGTKSPVVGFRGQFGKEGDALRRAWETANTEPKAFLEVEMMEIDGKPASLPQAVTFEPPIAGTIAAIRQSDEDLKSTAGFRDASLAERGPQESGRAIELRQDQDTLGSSHYLDNLRFALCAGGRQLIQLIRAVMDAPQVVRIIGKDERPKKVLVFSGKEQDPRNDQWLETHPAEATEPLSIPSRDEGGEPTMVQPGGKIPYQLPEGVTEIYDLGVGEYDVEVAGTPNHGTRRQEDLQMISEVLKGLPPEISAKFLDLYFKLIDSPVAREMHERAKKMFPPPEDQENEPNLQAQFSQMQGEFQQMGQALQEAQLELKTERDKIAAQIQINQEKLASQERVVDRKIAGELAVTTLEHKGDTNLAQMEARVAAIMSHIDKLHERAMAHEGVRTDAATGDLEHQRATERADVDHQRDKEATHEGRVHEVASAAAEAAVAPKPEGGGA